MGGALALLFGSPASGVRSVHPDKRAEMFELPFAVYFDIVVLVAHGSPFGLILFSEGKRPQTIPGHLGLISIESSSAIALSNLLSTRVVKEKIVRFDCDL